MVKSLLNVKVATGRIVLNEENNKLFIRKYNGHGKNTLTVNVSKKTVDEAEEMFYDVVRSVNNPSDISTTQY